VTVCARQSAGRRAAAMAAATRIRMGGMVFRIYRSLMR
jgi:hypothetical protein